MKKILCLFLLINFCKINSQTIEGFERISNHSYSYQGKTGKLHEFKDLFQSNREYIDDFNKFNTSRNIQKKFNFIALGSLTIGSLLINTSVHHDIGGGLGDELIIFSLGFGGVVSGTTFLIFGNAIYGSSKISAKKSLLKKMNLTDYSSHYDSGDIQLELKATNNGIGLVYTF